jgi:hypothetical protein
MRFMSLRPKVGTDVRLAEMTKGGENFSNWLTRLIEPRLMMEFLDFEEDESRHRQGSFRDPSRSFHILQGALGGGHEVVQGIRIKPP